MKTHAIVCGTSPQSCSGPRSRSLSTLRSVRAPIVSRPSSRQVDFLLATDLAGRGLDIKNVEAVINFEVPRNLADYVHRVGRTARAGRAGKAVTLADDSARTKKMLKEIVRGAPGVVKRRVVPPEAVDAMRAKIEDWEEEIDAIIEEEKVLARPIRRRPRRPTCA